MYCSASATLVMKSLCRIVVMGAFARIGSVGRGTEERRDFIIVALRSASPFAPDQRALIADCSAVWLDCEAFRRIAPAPRLLGSGGASEEIKHVNDRVGIPRATDLSAAARIRRAGERQEGRFRRDERRRGGRLHRLLGEARARTRSRGTSRSRARSTNRSAPFYKWFDDGELNVSYNCLDRNLANGNANRVAIIFEADDGTVTKVTYQELYHRVCRLANGLKSLGIRKGDRVLVYMPMSIEGVVAMQACARIGATHSVVFGGFSAKSLQERIIDAGAVAVITADEQARGGKHLPLKAIVDEALGMGGCESIRNVVVYKRTGGNVAFAAPRDLWLHELVAKQADTCEPEWVGAEHPLFILYTSGSTGKPKGVQHSSGGFLLWAILTMRWTFDIKPTDVFWCTADIGWVTGHTYIAYGPLAVGATEVVFEGVPTYPDAGRFWQTIAKHKVSIFYTAPTAIRALVKASGVTPSTAPKNYDLSSLRLLGTVGEPINPEAWMWYHEQVGGGRCPIVDTWWQTETGGHMITPLPGVTATVPGSCTLPLPGIMAAIVDETGQDVANGHGGILVIKRPWPAMIRTIWGDPDRYQEVVLSRGARRQALSRRRRRGARQDDRALHDHGPDRRRAERLGPPAGNDGDRVGARREFDGRRSGGRRTPRRHDGRGRLRVRRAEADAPVGRRGARRSRSELRDWVGKEIGPIAKPKDIRFGDNLPKTRSGKIMRRLLRSIAKGEAITQDVSTLENPAILEQLKQTL